MLRDRYPAIEIELVESSGGVFEVRRAGALVFSKLATGRFPKDEEIFSVLDG